MKNRQYQVRSRRRRVGGIALSVATVLIGSVITTSGVSTTATAATKSEVITGASRSSVAEKIAAAGFSAGSTRAVIAADTAAETRIGANLAARLGVPLLVSTSGSSASSVSALVKKYGVTAVTTVSLSESYFTQVFVDELAAAGATVSTKLSGASEYDLSVNAAAAGGHAAEYVLANTGDQFAAGLAASYAGERGLPLVLYAAATPQDKLSELYTTVGTSVLTYVGKLAEAPTAGVSETQLETFYTQDTTDTRKAMIWSVAQAQAAGSNMAKVVTAPGDAPDALGLAGLYAHQIGGIAVPAGKTGALTTSSRTADLLSYWRTSAVSVSLVGVNLTTTDLTNVAKPTTVAANTAPAFRATNLTRTTAGGFTLTVSAVSGATRYRALLLDGTQAATSTSTTLTFKESIPSLLVVAEKSTTELARFNFRMNSYDDAGQRETVVLGTVNNGQANLRFLSSKKTPKLITRSMSNPFDPTVEPTSEQPVAITCADNWTDAGLDKTKEYEYAVTALSNVDTNTCNGSIAPQPASADATNTARLAMPFTQMPTTAAARSSSSLKATTATKTEAASPTRIDMLMAKVVGQQSTQSTSRSGVSTRAVGDDWADVLVRWQAFIPEGILPSPLPSWDFARPFTAIHGDGHGFNKPNESYRFRQDLQVGFGSDHYVKYLPGKIGETIMYKCKAFYNDCVVKDRKTAPTSEIAGGATLSTNTFGAGWFRASTTMPLIAAAPPIDTDVQVYLGPGVSKIFGYHDNMPKHEAFFGVVQSEWYRVYSSPYVGYAQLPCLYSSPKKIIRGCGTVFNAQI